MEELLAKRKAEEEALSRPKFYTKEERAQQALQKRMEEVRLQRERADSERKKAMQEMRAMGGDERRGACDESFDESTVPRSLLCSFLCRFRS